MPLLGIVDNVLTVQKGGATIEATDNETKYIISSLTKSSNYQQRMCANFCKVNGVNEKYIYVQSEYMKEAQVFNCLGDLINENVKPMLKMPMI